MNSRKNPTLKSCRVKVGITIGDPSGIGPAVAFKAIRELEDSAEFVVIGDEWVFNKAQRPKYKTQGYKFIDLNNVKHKDFEFGKVKAEYGRASMEYLDKALELIKTKAIDCLVTAPISKEAINKARFRYSGHTEYFGERTGSADPVMMLLNKELRFSLVTRHVPLRLVSSKINEDNLCRTISVTCQSLKKQFCVREPRIVVCGLNPHASDNGVIGEEESRLIRPVVEKLKKRLCADIEGPLSPDVAIARARRREFDCVIAMYHDQALIPLKLLGAAGGVNLTLGLPFVRTSPLHGTAFDIAKRPWLADPGSMIEAIRLAVKCTLNLKRG
jgi:4-hydroxythreonine-4-phosphate dehydrogenase